MDVVFRFLMWFVGSFLILVPLKAMIPSDIFFSFFIALIFGFLAVREGE